MELRLIRDRLEQINEKLDKPPGSIIMDRTKLDTQSVIGEINPGIDQLLEEKSAEKLDGLLGKLQKSKHEAIVTGYVINGEEQ